jgi:glutathione S-transferase
MVVHLLDELGLAYTEKNISTDIEAAAELLDHGGKGQVPYLIDTTTGIDLYESAAIAEYLQTMYGNPPVGEK